jgi:hypothetical protein
MFAHRLSSCGRIPAIVLQRSLAARSFRASAAVLSDAADNLEKKTCQATLPQVPTCDYHRPVDSVQESCFPGRTYYVKTNRHDICRVYASWVQGLGQTDVRIGHREGHAGQSRPERLGWGCYKLIHTVKYGLGLHVLDFTCC